MAWSPISLFVPQFELTTGLPANGYVLKAYQAGTSTNTPMATDSTGATQVTSIALNADGYPSVSGNIVIPHINRSFKLALYPSQAAADANTGAKWSPDNLVPIENVAFANSVNSQTTTYTIQASDKSKLIYFSGAGGVTLNLLAAATAGDGFSFLVENDTSGNVTIDPSGAEQVNNATTLILRAGQSAIVICNGSSWRALDPPSSFVASTLEIYDPTDTTKKIIFDAGSIATGQTRTITMGDANFSLRSATQAEMEAATSNAVVVTPGTQKFHPGMAKAWGVISLTAGVPSLTTGYNLSTTITDTGIGDITLSILNSFSTANYVAIITCAEATNVTFTVIRSGGGTFNVRTSNAATGAATDASFTVALFGDQ